MIAGRGVESGSCIGVEEDQVRPWLCESAGKPLVDACSILSRQLHRHHGRREALCGTKNRTIGGHCACRTKLRFVAKVRAALAFAQFSNGESMTIWIQKGCCA